MKKMIAILAVMAAAALAAAPVDAGDQKPLTGPMQLELFLASCPDPLLPPFLTWAGTVELDGTVYGFADFPTAPLVDDGKFIYFEEFWTVFSLEEGEDVSPAVACDSTRVVLAGINDGWGTPGFAAKADGSVTQVVASGPFDDLAFGSRMFWRGRIIGEARTDFVATIHLQPPR